MNKKKVYYIVVGGVGILLLFCFWIRNGSNQELELQIQQTTEKKKAEQGQQTQVGQIDEKKSDFSEPEEPVTEPEAKKAAEQFIKAYHKRSPDYNYLEHVQEYITDELYDYLKGQEQPQVWMRMQQTVEEISVVPTADKQTETHVTLCIIVRGKYISGSGEVMPGEDWYLVSMDKAVDGWKVTGIWINITQ